MMRSRAPNSHTRNVHDSTHSHAPPTLTITPLSCVGCSSHARFQDDVPFETKDATSERLFAGRSGGVPASGSSSPDITEDFRYHVPELLQRHLAAAKEALASADTAIGREALTRAFAALKGATAEESKQPSQGGLAVPPPLPPPDNPASDGLSALADAGSDAVRAARTEAGVPYHQRSGARHLYRCVVQAILTPSKFGQKGVSPSTLAPPLHVFRRSAEGIPGRHRERAAGPRVICVLRDLQDSHRGRCTVTPRSRSPAPSPSHVM